ncbi:MAG: metallophosphoesterase family protein [Mariprofundales bacterium]|nr:metallophosphoesterase family protein [Mariprofundales bacterium]
MVSGSGALPVADGDHANCPHRRSISDILTHPPYQMRLRLPKYHGAEWLQSRLPTTVEPWLDGNKHLLRHRQGGSAKTRHRLKQLLKEHRWQWPQRDICFISDLHADADALFAALIASGGIKKTGAADEMFHLTKQGRAMLFIFGGDFFEKGPSNLRLLRAVKLMIDRGARVRILAGNHDIRVLFGMQCAGRVDDPLNSHFFIRMGRKAIPFLCEIRDNYLKNSTDLPSDKECRTLLFPHANWRRQFTKQTANMLSPNALANEIEKIERNSRRFAQQCAKSGLSLAEAYAAARKWQQLFLSKRGEFSWFFKQMKLVYRKGSFLFVHAGVDDLFAASLHHNGVATINRQFKKQLAESPVKFYYGAEANAIRTKYRSGDRKLTARGSFLLHTAGIHALVHGHRNLHRGQRIALRKSMLHFECDVTLDIHSRHHEGLSGLGGGVTIIQPEQRILGISSDYQHIKLFDNGVIHAK